MVQLGLDAVLAGTPSAVCKTKVQYLRCGSQWATGRGLAGLTEAAKLGPDCWKDLLLLLHKQHLHSSRR